jgi:excisionase family DNA binding protein
MPTRPEPAVLTVPEVAAVLRMSKVLVYRACRRGQIPHIRVGHRVVVPAWWLEEQLGRKKGACAGG